MGAILQVELTVKGEIPADQMEDIKSIIVKKLKAKVAKEKVKGRKIIWTLKAPKPDLVTEEALTLIFKRQKLQKVVRQIEARVSDHQPLRGYHLAPGLEK